MDEQTGKQNTLKAFFSHPFVGILGSVASIIGFGLSIYFYLATQEQPKLTCFVHPVKAAVVRAGQTSNITVQFEGKALTGDVTAAQIAFWNAGKKSIRAANVLRPLTIRTTGRIKILEARLKKTTRDVTEVVLDAARLAVGEVEVKWNILEQNDGGVIQLVYCGDEKDEIKISAVVEGQRELAQYNYVNFFMSSIYSWNFLAFLCATLPLSIIFSVFFLKYCIPLVTISINLNDITCYLLIIPALTFEVILIILSFIYRISIAYGPPFSF